MWWLLTTALASGGPWVHMTLSDPRPAPSGPADEAREVMVSAVVDEVGDGEVIVHDARTERYVRVDAAPTFAVRAAYALAADVASLEGLEVSAPVGVERDYWDEGRLIVARRWPDGTFEIRRGPYETYSLPLAPPDLVDSLGASSIDGPFTERERALLWAAHAALDPMERSLLEGTRYVRRPRSSAFVTRTSASFGFTFWWEVAPRAVYYDAMYSEGVVNGVPGAPLANGLWTSVRELGHGIEGAGAYRAVAVGTDASRACRSAFEDARPVWTAFTAASGPHRLTDRAHEDDSAAFVDAFALYRLHPDFLELASPEVFEWFEGEGHLAWIFDPRWQPCLGEERVIRAGPETAVSRMSHPAESPRGGSAAH